MSKERDRGVKLLSDALDHIDEAIHLLREYAKRRSTESESLEDVVFLLEEAGEALDRIIRERERAG